jgi:hypothetical protein
VAEVTERLSDERLSDERLSDTVTELEVPGVSVGMPDGTAAP